MSGAMSATMVMQAGGLALSAYGALNSSQQSKAAYAAQGQIAANNAVIAGWKADDALERGQIKANRVGMQTRQLKGRQRAALAANGVDLGVGSAQEILTDTDYFGQIDREQVLTDAAREAWGYRMQGKGFANDSSMLTARADAESPLLNTATTLLSGAGKVASSWYTNGSAGPGVSGGRLGVPGFSSMGTYG